MTDRIEQLTRLLQADPTDAFCAYGLAMEHAKRGECDRAIEWFDRTLALDPSSCYSYFHKARVQHAAGALDDAVHTLRTGLGVARSCGDLKAAGEIESLLDEYQE